MDEKSCLIALLEWELAASQAREAELRNRVAKALQGQSEHFHMLRPKAHDLWMLWKFLQEPQDDRRLIQRLATARHDIRQVMLAMGDLLIAKSAAIGALRHELDHAKGTV